jgi:uncharacterized protein (TIGR03435 family)
MRRMLLIVSTAVLAAIVGGRAHAQSDTKPLAFDVVSIKAASFPSDAFFAGWLAGAGTCRSYMQVTGNRVALARASLCGLVGLAYDVHDYQVTGAPGWMMKLDDQSFYYDIDARAESGAALTRDEAREMLKTMLADRFKLQLHHELRDAPVYALVVNKNGPKFAASGDKFVSVHGFKMCGNGATSAGGTGLIASCGPNPSGSMASLAQNLSLHTDRTVVDKTGLTGQYAFMLEWAPEDGAPGDLPSLFTAIQDQIGLKLEPQRAPVDTIVIDRAEKPTPN